MRAANLANSKADASAAAPASLRQKLARFAAGRSSEAERREVKRLLVENADLIPLLVAELRGLRNSGA